jgi:hypothetical protein
MTQHTKIIFKKSILSVFLITQLFVNCKGNTADSISENHDEVSNLNAEKSKEIDVKNPISATQWIYIKSVPIVASVAKNSISCDDKKYGELNIRIQNDSVFLFDTYTDKVSTGKVKSKDFFKEKYMYDFYKKMLQDEVRINLGETVNYARNTRAYSKDSKLDAYFRDAFFIEQFMFIESNGCVYIYKKNADVKTVMIDKTASRVATQKIVELPFDFNDYYNSCIYPSDKSCRSKYPSNEFNNGVFLKAVETAIAIPEPSIYFALPSATKEVAIYIVAYQGNDNDSYHLLSMKDDKVISKLEIGSMDGTTLNDFVITKDNLVNLYTRKSANEKRKLKEIYKIASTGKFESQNK